MACGSYRGKNVDDPAVRAMFTREALLASDWYAERLLAKQTRDVALWKRHVAALEGAAPTPDVDLAFRLEEAKKQLARVSAAEYLKEL